MKIKKTTLLLGALAVLSQSCENSVDSPEANDYNSVALKYRGEVIASLEPSPVLDAEHSLFVYNGNNVHFDSLILIKKDTFQITPNDSELQLGKAYIVTHRDSSYTLYRTELPLVVINTGNVEIPDDPKISGNLVLLETGKNPFTSLIGIERRGGISQTFPKKSYSVELWEDPLGDNTKNESLLGMRNDDDWILDGLWNEPLRIRDYTSHDIWLKMGRADYVKEYDDDDNHDHDGHDDDDHDDDFGYYDTKDAKKKKGGHHDKGKEITLGIKRKFCEVFVNGSYRGIYYLGEKVDRKQLAIKEYDGRLRGELYKGDTWANGVTFIGLDDYSNGSKTWSGYEAEYPDKVGELDWGNLHDFVNLVVNSSKKRFDDKIRKRVDIENMADYFIFLNVIYAPDNTGKNLFTARYDRKEPYFFVPWDMDGTWGDEWTGDRLTNTDFILSNGLYDRLLLNKKFKKELRSRWKELKSNVLSPQNLKGMFRENFRYLKNNGAYERENLNPELPQRYSDTEIDFIATWIDTRIVFVDNYINGL